jgi:hypothetical protein
MLLTLDLASKTGWTFGAPDDKQFASGVYPIAQTGKDDIGHFLADFDAWLSERLVDVAFCVFESPIFPGAKGNLGTLRKLYSLAGHLEWRCLQAKIQCFEVNTMAVKRFMGIAGIWGKPGKQAMIRAVERYGYEPVDDNEADAIGLRLYTIHLRYPALADAFHLRLGALGAA